MKLVDNWRHILVKSWSLRLVALTYALVALAEYWPMLAGVLPVGWVIGIGLPLAFAARVLDQGIGK